MRIFALVGLCAGGGALALASLTAGLAHVGEYAQQQRGRYLTDLGDCAACHTAEGGQPFAGGRPIETPFGTIYSPNITPDPDTGIGAWTDDQFYRAMHEGIAEDGTRLYPAFPYPWFTKVTREDVDAIRAYLLTLPAVRSKRPENTLVWPLNHSLAMVGWNTLFFRPGTFQPDPAKTAEWNRGAYLVEGLGHCGACHSPKNVFGAVKESERYQGSQIQNWFAPNLTGDMGSGLGGWSVDDIVRFLKTGHTERTLAYGPMSEVVSVSTSKMEESDLRAMAEYLKSLPSQAGTPEKATADHGISSQGEAIYYDQCSACHQIRGEGVPGLFPALKGGTMVHAQDPSSMIRLDLEGGRGAWTSQDPNAMSMPSFNWKLSDEQVAAVVSYIRAAWGNAAPPVSADAVKTMRKALEPKSEQ